MMTKYALQDRILTGDRTTGRLHLGHYVGSLKNRVTLQDQYETFVMLADVQALTTNFDRPEQLQVHVKQIALDYLAVGIDPNKTTIFIQSLIPEIAELTVFYSMFVTVNALRHNPTIKSEAAERGYKDLYYGFLGYPVSQAADITFCKATLVPVGEDQLPHIEQTRKIVRRFNELYKPVFPEPRALVGDVPRLIGLDGNSKMSKSKDNAIYLDATRDEVDEKIRKAVTDPARIRTTDPGHPEICPIYSYHQTFRPGAAEEIGQSCRQGKIGCAACKQLITKEINGVLEPMRERRAQYAGKAKVVDDILQSGVERARSIAKHTMEEVRDAMSMSYFDAPEHPIDA